MIQGSGREIERSDSLLSDEAAGAFLRVFDPSLDSRAGAS